MIDECRNLPTKGRIVQGFRGNGRSNPCTSEKIFMLELSLKYTSMAPFGVYILHLDIYIGAMHWMEKIPRFPRIWPHVSIL